LRRCSTSEDMDELDEYYSGCQSLAEAMWHETRNPPEYLDKLFKNGDKRFKQLVDTRIQLVDVGDYANNSAYLTLGFFADDNMKQRISCFCVLHDITERMTILEFKRRFEPYTRTHPLFEGEPALWEAIRKSSDKGDPDLELISLSELSRAKGSEIISLKGGGYAVMDYALNPFIVDWVEGHFDTAKTYVRIDPYSFSSTQPLQRLHEAILRPANPNWWKELKIHLRKHEGCAYTLDDCDPRTDQARYIEKHLKRVERLEIKANRDNDGLLSMMIEEVTTPDHHGLMINRVIHMDTDAEYGTPFLSAKLKHLDIAIYVYANANARKRDQETISTGERVTEADHKCHLLRVDDLDFHSMFGFAQFFLKSKSLLSEWINDQFQGNVPTSEVN
jgi:hypothetical protein